MSKYYCVRCLNKIGILDRIVVDDKIIRISNGKDTNLYRYREIIHHKCLTPLEKKSLTKKRKKKGYDDDDSNNNDYIYTDR